MIIKQIPGETHHDVHFSQGLLTAELRLWEMEFQRRVGRGTLSELVGKAGLGHDKMSRTLGLYASAERAVASLEGYAAAAIQSYTDGVNEYLRSNATLPFEMILLGVDRYNIDPWMPADSLVWGKIMALELSGNMKVEWMRYQLLAGANLTVDEVNQIIAPFDTLKFPTVLTTDDLNTTSLRDHLHVVDAAAAVPSKEAQDFYESYRGSAKIPSSSFSSSATSSSASDHHRVVRLLRSEEGHGASNNWVVGGSRTTTNKPMLANDPHLQLTAPSVWIATHLKVEPKPTTTTKAQRNTTVTTPMDVWGAAFAGMPGIVTGRNAHIAWGVTNTGVDVQDLFIMEEDMKKHPGEYMWNGVWIKYMTRKEIIHIKNSESLTIIVRTSNAGVVITDNSVASQLGCMKELAKNLGPGQETMSLKWVSIDPTIPDVSPASFFNINLATTYDEYRKALRGYVAPAQNFIYADIHGNIGYQMPGFVPRRAAGHTGKMPVSGNGKYAWRTTSSPSADGADGSGLITDKIPFDHMPRAYNPKKGFFASANNRVVPPFNDITGKDPFAKDGYVLSHDWDGSNMGYRSRSITNMIKDLSDVGGSATVGTAAGTTDSPLKKMNMTGMRDMQKSYVSGLWIDFSPYLNSMLMSPVTLSDAAKKWIPRLTDNITFGGDMAVGAVEPTVFQKWLLQVLELVSKVSTNDNNERSCYLPKRMFNVVWVLKAMEMGHTACGGKGEAHDCLAYAANILNDVVKEYEDETVAVPRWGIDVHRALFEHQVRCFVCKWMKFFVFRMRKKKNYIFLTLFFLSSSSIFVVVVVVVVLVPLLVVVVVVLLFRLYAGSFLTLSL